MQNRRETAGFYAAFRPGGKLAGEMRYRAVQQHGESRQNKQAGEHQIHLGTPIGEQHQIAEPLGCTDPFADHRPDGRIDGGEAQTRRQRRKGGGMRMRNRIAMRPAPRISAASIRLVSVRRIPSKKVETTGKKIISTVTAILEAGP